MREIDRLLKLLAGSSEGVTSYTLHQVHKISLRCMEDAISRGYARGQVENVVGLTGKPVVRLHITKAGRALLELTDA